MFERITTGWRLAKQSLQVLKLDRELLLFPLLSGMACLLVLASFAVPIFWSGTLDGVSDDKGTQALLFVVGFLYYFCTYFVIIFFNSALVGCAIIRLKGGDPTVKDGFGAALSRIPQIAGWALVSATVGIILKAIESRSERVGQIVSGILGMAWSVTTFFVIPVLVVEKTGPIDAVKRSVSIMRDSWGESLSANFGIGLMTMLGCLIASLPIMAGTAILASSAILGWILIALGIVAVFLVILISSAAGSVLLAALYVFAAEGEMPEIYDASLLEGAFAQR